jgi:hypothetical protein
MNSLAHPSPMICLAHQLFRCFRFRCAARHFPYRRHHLIRGGLLDHVAVSDRSVKPALRNVGMQPGRPCVDVDQPVLVACNDDNRHLQTGMRDLKASGIMSADSAADARIC